MTCRETFRANRGYDITPYLPAVLQPARDQTFFFFSGLRAAPDFSFGPESERLIHDYDLTISDLFFKHWYPASREWAEQHNLLFRQQGYNPPLDVIKAASAAHLPETEGGNERLLKRVTSGAHLYGRPLISAESFVFYPQGGYGLTPQDYKEGIDLLMTAGVNFILYHGTPYRWPQLGYGETGWAPFVSPYGSNITSNVSEADPFWKFQADLNLYAARVQYLLQQGAPDADLLVYLPIFADPADARFAPMLQAVETHGRAWEWVNDELLVQAEWSGASLRVGAMDFQAVLLPDVESLPPATAARLAELAQAGAPVIVVGNLPARQPGFLNYAENDGLVARHMQTVISQAQCAHVAEAGDLAACLRSLPAAPLAYEENDALRLIRRKLPDGGYVAFVRNTSRQPIRFVLTVGPALRACYWLDATDGKVYRAEAVDGRLAGRLPGLGAMALLCSSDDVFAAEELAEGNPVGEAKVVASFALTEWTLTVKGEDVPGGELTVAADALGDWRLREALTYVSSPGVYATVASLDEVVAGHRYVLDLGEVFAAAEVSVNGQAAGRALFSPWQVDITACLHAGDNAIRVEVTPALHNRLLGKALGGDAEYVQFLGDRSGPRRPLPSGLVGPVMLQAVEAAA